MVFFLIAAFLFGECELSAGCADMPHASQALRCQCAHEVRLAFIAFCVPKREGTTIEMIDESPKPKPLTLDLSQAELCGLQRDLRSEGH